jgi:thioredoxin-related protein
MKIMLLFILNFFFVAANWHYNFDEAKQLAKQENKNILLSFSGSDWCGPCIRMHKEIFESDSFQKMADQYLVMVNADFPRMKKDQLPADQQKLNDAMADKYDPQGIFPLTLLLNADGKVLKEWDGFPKETTDDFINEIKQIADNR